jgi:hypothetical protein
MSSGHESLAHSQNNINSRYHADFIELEELGRGGFGSVVKVPCSLLEKNRPVQHPTTPPTP